MNGTVCNCCVTTEPPVTIDNRPGLAVISYRSGTWAEFKAIMLSSLSLPPQLSGLQTRSDDDFTIALLDAWAIVCDILTFYQERIATESYLRTATQLVSVGELAKLIGYKLRPGLAASVALAFDLSAALPGPPAPSTTPTGSPPSVLLDVGTKAQSIPDPGQQPATFETIAPISPRAEWTQINPRMTAPGAGDASKDITLSGVDSPVNVGDVLLLACADAPVSRQLQRVAQVTPTSPTQATNTNAQTTVVQFGPTPNPPGRQPPPTTQVTVPVAPTLNEAFVQTYVKGLVWAEQATLVALAAAQNWPLDDLEARINAANTPGQQAVTAFVMGVDAALFGHNAPTWNTLPSSAQGSVDWENLNLSDSKMAPGLPGLDLDQVYPAIVADALVAMQVAENPSVKHPELKRGLGEPVFTTVTGVQELTRSDYLISAKVTRLTIDPSPLPQPPSVFTLRGTQVLVSTGELPVTELTVDEDIGSGSLELDGAYLSLTVGQLVAVTGVRQDKPGATETEIVAIDSLSLVDGFTTVKFNPELAGTYVRSSVTINANVAPATHGATTSQNLGSGDASQTFQSFVLKQPPLTYVSATTPSGAASTLAVTVDGVEWSEVPWLYGSGRTSLVYMVIQGSDGKTYVQFGDGVTGARPGSGTNNIVATYRTGIGTSGLARAGQISQLLSRPLGLKSVINPLDATGATDPETLEQARPNAPISVKTLGRIVSLEDFGDFAAASPGIGKAASSWVWDGTCFLVCVTVAGTEGAPVVAGSLQATSLLQAMQEASDGTVPMTLCNYVSTTFTIGATVTADPTLVASDVLTAVKAAIAQTFSFDARAFGQPVARSEVIATVQNVPGVVAMTLAVFDATGGGGLQDVLPANPPTLSTTGLVGAQLLTLEPGLLPGVVLAS